jgi:tetratricopeptide (TPR) repeat protein
MIVDRPPPEGETLERQRATIRQTLGTSKRTAARWLLAYERFFSEPDKALADWEQLLTEETAALANRSAEASTDQVFRLRKRQYAMLLARDRKDDAQNVIRQMVQLQPAETQALVEFIEWLTKAEAWSAIDELSKRHAGVFEKNPILVYALANAQLSAGKKEEAEKTAARALTIRATEPMTHLVVAHRLADMGLFTWAEREYRFVIENSPDEARLAILAGLTLSAMFQDQQKYLDAAQARETIVKKIEGNPALREQLESSSSSSLAPKRIRAGMEYCYAMHYAAAGDTAKQIEHLDKAAERDPQDADVLIALYRLPNQDEKRRKATRSLIDRATRSFQREIDEYEPLAVESEDFQGFLATKYNEYAWLVSNTYGDFDKALHYSIKSNEIHDNAEGGLLDTLGRCYYAKGDLENAIRTQARALQLDPHSGAIARQLAFFREEKAKRDGGKGEAGTIIAPLQATEPD